MTTRGKLLFFIYIFLPQWSGIMFGSELHLKVDFWITRKNCMVFFTAIVGIGLLLLKKNINGEICIHVIHHIVRIKLKNYAMMKYI